MRSTWNRSRATARHARSSSRGASATAKSNDRGSGWGDVMKLSRRHLVLGAGALAALPIASHRALAALAREQPSLVLRNARVITIDRRQPVAEAIAIAGERI